MNSTINATTPSNDAPSTARSAFSRPAALIGGGIGLVALTAIATTLVVRSPSSSDAARKDTGTMSAQALMTPAAAAAIAAGVATKPDPKLEAKPGTDDGVEPAAKSAPQQEPARAPSSSSKTTTAKPAPARSTTATAAAKPGVCTTCGVIESVTPVEQKGKGTGVGAVGGAVVGGVLGHQMGGGRGKDAMTAVGIVGGGIAGHEIEKRARATTVYQVRVRMDDGSVRTVTQSTAPTVGQKVTMNGQQIRARG